MPMNRSSLQALMAILASSALLWHARPVPATDGDPAGVDVRMTEEIERQWQALTHDLTRLVHFEYRGGGVDVAAETAHPEALVRRTDRDPTDIALRRAEALLADLMNTGAAPRLADHAARLKALRDRAGSVPPEDTAARRALFGEVCQVRRTIAFANPLLNFDRILFIKRHRSLYNHMCDQYYGITARPGGGLYVLENAFGAAPSVRDLLDGARVENGRLAGQPLRGGNGAKARLHYDGERALTGDETEGGAFLSPALSHDAREILFAYVECAGDREQRFHTDPTRGHWHEGRCYHLFRVRVDGTGLTQLTDGTWNDFDPCWLPNGRIAFISERRGGYLRCGRACPVYTLHDMAADGSEINLLSFHDSNEWHPSVTHDGRIVWTRWDYIDRHGCVAHTPWITRLDGTDPRAMRGSYAPRARRPDMELHVRPIPGSPKFVATAAPHHGQAYGSLIVFDPRIPDDDGMAPVRRLTPEVGFPESQDGREVYGTPWPLSETYHLCVYDPEVNRLPMESQQPSARPRPDRGDQYGIYLVDAFGNKELIYRDPEIGCLNPIPLRPTPIPPVTVSPFAEATARPAGPGSEGTAVVGVVNVYDTIRPWPEDRKPAALRIYQVLPCTVPSGGRRPHETGARIREADDSIVPARRVLGTVPIEADGSAHFTVPAYRQLFFQVLDERGLAIQSMRSGTAARDGEKLLCMGCHEDKHKAVPPAASTALALRRPPSVPAPDVDGANPFSYPRLVQPVLDRHCVDCHARHPETAPNLGREPIRNRWYASYHSLLPFAFTSYGDRYRTVPGRFGARATKLFQMLEDGHHDLKLPAEDLHRITLWLDSASMFYGVFEEEGGQAQLRGEIAHPTLE